jgi:hypothetical protein
MLPDDLACCCTEQHSHEGYSACVRPDEQFLLDERIRVSDRRGAIDVASIAASQRQQAVADHGGENSLALLLRSTKKL